MAFYGCLLSLSMFSGCIHVIACVCTCSFSWLNNIPLYGYTLFVHSSDWWTLGYFHILAIVYNGAVNIWVQVFVWTLYFSSLGYSTLGVEFLGHMVNYRFNLWRKYQVFCSGSFTLPPGIYEGSSFYIPTITCFLGILVCLIAILGAGRWWFIVVCISSFLMRLILNIFLGAYWPFCKSIFQMAYLINGPYIGCSSFMGGSCLWSSNLSVY